jgi:hypothetical protein
VRSQGEEGEMRKDQRPHLEEQQRRIERKSIQVCGSIENRDLIVRGDAGMGGVEGRQTLAELGGVLGWLIEEGGEGALIVRDDFAEGVGWRSEESEEEGGLIKVFVDCNVLNHGASEEDIEEEEREA